MDSSEYVDELRLKLPLDNLSKWRYQSFYCALQIDSSFFTLNPIEAEAKALRDGVTLALEGKIRKLEIEPDDIVPINAIMQDSIDWKLYIDSYQHHKM